MWNVELPHFSQSQPFLNGFFDISEFPHKSEGFAIKDLSTVTAKEIIGVFRIWKKSPFAFRAFFRRDVILGWEMDTSKTI